MPDSARGQPLLSSSGENLLQVNEELRRRVAELEALFELAPVGLAIARDPACRRIDPNPAMRRMLRLGLEANASRTAPPGELPPFRVMRDGVNVPPENLPMQVTARTGEPVNGAQCHVVFPNGEFVHLLGSTTPLFDEDDKPRGCIGAFLEITERINLERELRQARRVAEDAVRAKDRFLAVLGHELRNPLASIRNAVAILKRRSAALGSDERFPVEVIGRQTATLVRLVDDLLDIHRLNEGKIVLRREPVDLATVIRNAIEAAQPYLHGKGQTLDLALPDEPIFAHADAVRLVQVFLNLLSNAAKFTAEGGRIAITVERARRAKGEEVARIRVADNGVGVAPELLERIFDAYMQAASPGEGGGTGLGLGLSVARRLVALHGGSIRADSDGPGRGTSSAHRTPGCSVRGPSSRRRRGSFATRTGRQTPG